MRRLILWPLLIALPLLSACADKSMQDLYGFVDQVKSLKAGYIEPLPKIEQIKTFAYVGDGRRDPFALLSGEEGSEFENADNGIYPDSNRHKEELESYPLDSLRMVGVLEQDEVIWALILNRKNTIYRVKSGNYMGMSHGQITQVTENKVELTEIVSDPGGGYRERQASLVLRDNQENNR